jgi:hypothetical protein
MSNNKQSSLDYYITKLTEILGPEIIKQISRDDNERIARLEKRAEAMQQEQAHLYAAFVLKCVQNNLPPITFNDWINLENNEQ